MTDNDHEKEFFGVYYSHTLDIVTIKLVYKVFGPLFSASKGPQGSSIKLPVEDAREQSESKGKMRGKLRIPRYGTTKRSCSLDFRCMVWHTSTLANSSRSPLIARIGPCIEEIN